MMMRMISGGSSYSYTLRSYFGCHHHDHHHAYNFESRLFVKRITGSNWATAKNAVLWWRGGDQYYQFDDDDDATNDYDDVFGKDYDRQHPNMW